MTARATAIPAQVVAVLIALPRRIIEITPDALRDAALRHWASTGLDPMLRAPVWRLAAGSSDAHVAVSAIDLAGRALTRAAASCGRGVAAATGRTVTTPRM